MCQLLFICVLEPCFLFVKLRFTCNELKELVLFALYDHIGTRIRSVSLPGHSFSIKMFLFVVALVTSMSLKTHQAFDL